MRRKEVLSAFVFALGAALGLVVGLAGPGGAVVADDPAATVSGTVSDWDGTAVPEAKIDLFRRAGDSGNQRAEFVGFALTDAAGRYSFDVAGGCYVLVFIAPEGREYVTGRFDRVVACAAADGASPVVDVALAPAEAERSASIGGTVTNADGSPAFPSRVILYRAGPDGSRSTWLGWTRTDQGGYSFDVTPGCYILDFAPPEGGRFDRGLWFQADACVGPGELRTDVSARLDPITMTSIGGSVRGDNFQPVAGARVDLWVECCGQGTRSEFLGSTTTGGDGVYFFRLDEGGCYALVFIAPDGYSYDESRFAERRTCLETGDRVGDITVRATADVRQSSLSGEVFADPDLRQNHQVKVTLWRAEADGTRGEFLQPTFTGGSDVERYSFQVAAGCYWLVFEAPAGTGFFGRPFDELTTCVEPFAEVTGLDTILGTADGPAYAPATLPSSTLKGEPADGTIIARVPVTLDRVWDRPVAVRYQTEASTSDGRRPSHLDYANVEGELLFAPGESEKFIEVPIFADGREETDEDIVVRLVERRFDSLAGYEFGILTITDNGLGTPQAVIVGDGSAYEGPAGESGRWWVDFALVHPPEAQFQIQFSWELRPVAGVDDNQDLASIRGSSFFLTGTYESVIGVDVQGDDEVEPDEQFEIVVTEVRGLYDGTVADLSDTGIFTILNDDGLEVPPSGSVSMSTDAIAVTETAGNEWLPFTILVESPAPFQRSVWLGYHDGTATGGEDYYARSHDRIVVPAGATEVEHGIRIYGGNVVEPDETFSIELIRPSPGLLIGNGMTEITIIDDD